MSEFDTKAAELERSLEGAQSLTATFSAELKHFKTTMADTGREIRVLESGISRGLRRAIDGLVFDGGTLSEALKGVGTSMLDAAYAAAMRPVTKHGGRVLGTGLEAVIQGLMPFEKGAAFSQSKVMPFAKGGVVSGPVTFPMRGGMGLMGEAGPEAIMPLTRTAGGQLGVRAQTGRAVTVTMNITTPDVGGFQRSQSQIAASLTRALSAGQRNA